MNCPKCGSLVTPGAPFCPVCSEPLQQPVGAPQGFPVMPVLKICGNPETYHRMEGDMDFNAGRIVTGEASIAQCGEEALERLIAVLSGHETKNESLHYFSAIDIYCLGPVI